jgi:hypothetical protein
MPTRSDAIAKDCLTWLHLVRIVVRMLHLRRFTEEAFSPLYALNEVESCVDDIVHALEFVSSISVASRVFDMLVSLIIGAGSRVVATEILLSISRLP